MANGPDHTALRVALWRALHVELDEPPHVLHDTIGARLVGEEGWRARPDMQPDFSKPMRASMVGRARFAEDLLAEKGASQYVLLGAGLDTYAQRHPDSAGKVRVFEIDQPGTQAWKRQRLAELGLPTPEWLRFVPVDFEKQSWWSELPAAGFDAAAPAVVVSTGVSMYLTRETNRATLAAASKLAPGSAFAMTFLLALELLDARERGSLEFVMKRAAEAGTPFHSLFRQEELTAMAREVGFPRARTVSGEELYQRYFAARTDGLRAGHAEAFLVAET